MGVSAGSVAVIFQPGQLYGCLVVEPLVAVMFHFGSAICGASPTMGVLLVGQVISGIESTAV